MKMVQMDRFDFSDNFSYINYLIWSYGLFSMIFRSLGHFLEFSDISKIEIIQKRGLLRQHYVMVMSAGQLGGSRSNLTSGATGK